MSTVPNFFELLFQRLETIENKLDGLSAAPLPEAKTRALSVTQAANFLGMSKSRLYTLIHLGEIPNYKRGSRVYFDRDELDQWILANKRG